MILHRGGLAAGRADAWGVLRYFRVVLTQAVHCHHHPQRLGIGICVECRQVVCAECSTQFEGINRCARCLAKLAPKGQAKSTLSEWGVASLLGAACCGGLLFGAVWLLAAWVGP
jgi:hypothetical protein